MALFARKTSILAKIESVYGTDPVPTGLANAMVVTNVSLTPLEMDLADRNLYLPHFGASRQILADQRVQLSFDVEIAGAGTSAVTKAQYDPLLRACGMSSVVNSTTSIDYAGVSTGFESITLYTFIDGIKHALVGAMGNVSFEFSDRKIPYMKFKFTGKYVVPADSTNPALTITAWQTPLAVNNTNTTGFALHGYSGILQSLTIDVGNQVVHKNWVGADFITIANRNPTGQITMQLPDTLAAKDWFVAARATTLAALTLTHGTVAFNKFAVVCGSTVQVMKPTYGESDGIRTISAELKFVPTSAGNDEFLFRTN